MSDLVIYKPEGMDEQRWQATMKWVNGWLYGLSMFGSPWDWEVCAKHTMFTHDCECKEEE